MVRHQCPVPALCMLKDHSSICTTMRLDKHQLILCAGKDTGKVLKMAIKIKKLEVVEQVIFNALITALRLSQLLSGREKHSRGKFTKNELHTLMAQFISKCCLFCFNSQFMHGSHVQNFKVMAQICPKKRSGPS